MSSLDMLLELPSTDELATTRPIRTPIGLVFDLSERVLVRPLGHVIPLDIIAREEYLMLVFLFLLLLSGCVLVVHLYQQVIECECLHVPQ